MGYKLNIFAMSVYLVLSSCGGGSSDQNGGSDAPKLLVGQFVDSLVSGLEYRTATQSGITDLSGEFDYLSGESIVFSIGAIEFGPVTAAAIISPLDIANTRNLEDIEVVNIARLLQSLDADNDTSNGITISRATRMLASDLQLDFTDPNFENTSTVINLVSDSKAANGVMSSINLVSTTEAIAHLRMSLIDFGVISGCTSDNSKVGASGTLSTIDHGVSGTVTVIDDCTLLVSNFNYDGNGPDVYFYAGTDGQYNPNPLESTAFQMGSQLTRSYNNESFTLTLPGNKTLNDFNGISVWCEQFSVSFGDTLLKLAIKT